MKVALVCPYDWSAHGGVQTHVSHLARWLADRHEVRVFAPALRDDAPRDPWLVAVGGAVPIPYNRSIAPIALSPLALRRTVHRLERFEPHVVHVHEPLSPAVSLAASAFGPRPVVGTFHAWSSSGRLYRATAPLGRRVVHRLAVRIAVSVAARDFAAHSLGLAATDFRVVPNGVDVDAYRRAEPLPDLVDPERPLLLFVGRLEPRKGLDVAIRAFLRLRATTPRLRLCVVGEGPERERCQQMVPPSIRPDVLFVGRVDEATKPRYHASADLAIAPNTGGESFGIVLLEAMAAGLAVVASDIPGFRTVVKDGHQGRLVPPGNAHALAEAIAALLDNDKLRRAMAAQGQATAQSYSWPLIGERVMALYREAFHAG